MRGRPLKLRRGTAPEPPWPSWQSHYSSIHIYSSKMSLASLIRSAPALGEQELCQGLAAQQLFGSVTEDHLLTVAAKAIDWSSLSNRERIARLSAFIRVGPHMPGFRAIVWEALGTSLFHRVWLAANSLATLSPEARGSWIWEHYLNAVDEHERIHDIYQSKATAMAPVLAERSNRYAIDYLTRNWHCDECGAFAMSQLSEERHAFILDQVKTEHAILEEEYLERQEARCRGGDY